MREIQLRQAPNQILSFVVDENFWEVQIKAIPSGVCSSISVNGKKLTSGFRVVEGMPLLPYQFMQAYGNLAIHTSGFPLNWEKFGDTQTLIYMGAEELCQTKELSELG